MTIHDEALAARVRAALAMDMRVSGLPIDVRVSNGDIFVKGRVETLEQADIVQFIVRGVSGVRHADMKELGVAEAPR